MSFSCQSFNIHFNNIIQENNDIYNNSVVHAQRVERIVTIERNNVMDRFTLVSCKIIDRCGTLYRLYTINHSSLKLIAEHICLEFYFLLLLFN